MKTVYLPEEALIWLAEKQSKQAQEAKVSPHLTTLSGPFIDSQLQQEKTRAARKPAVKRKAASKANGSTKCVLCNTYIGAILKLLYRRPRPTKKRKMDDSDDEESDPEQSDDDDEDGEKATSSPGKQAGRSDESSGDEEPDEEEVKEEKRSTRVSTS